ncbi:MAG TPA: PQQ-binding-like beta-propeller repeat protein, partial [Acidimicrobiales bacterium]|nr:PQQ-binding-like beta-propeller repeat protein [Acidimicrobiales bacterium]
EAVDPRAGTVAWQVPFSPSAISPGVTITPLTSGNVVIDMAPASGPTASPVTIEGIDITTGKALWATTSPATVTDAPELCTEKNVFCVNEAGAGSSGTVVALVPTTGRVLGTVAGPYRQMTTNLYETGSTPPAFEQLTAGGVPAWTAQVSTLFGGTQYSPQYGWNFVTAGSLDVGTVGVAPNGNSEPLGSYKTIGVRAADGTVQWTTSGSYQCFGVLQLAVPFVCRYSGTGTYSGGTLSTSGVGLTLSGIDTASGSLTWSRSLSSAQAVTTGNAVPIADASHIVVPVAGGGDELLDLLTGSVTAVPASEIMWCGQSQPVTVTASAAALSNGQRSASTTFTSCSGAGAPVSGTPSHAVPGVGVSVDGLFVWASPNGLQAVALPR